MEGSDNEQLADEQLLAAIVQGDQAAERALYRRYAAYGIKLASRFMQSRAEAEEVAQEAWLSLHRHLQRHSHLTEFRAYFAAVIVNKCRNVLGRQHDNASMDLALLAQLERMNPDAITSPAEDMAETADRERRRRALSKGLNKLSNLEYETIKLRYFDELSYSDIARALNRTEGNARRIAHRALNALRREIGGEQK